MVNNNAAAVMLALTAMARGREVVVSRGELVEIGGAFRVPEVMEQSGCILREVGATNKTHPGDYARAIGPDTAALLKVHTSNYRIVGFTEDVPLETLAQMAHEKGLPLLYDLGSGAMLPLEPYGVQDEPTVLQGLRAGADVICFSGDKLLGGPQAGILAGKQVWIDQMKHHPLLRALRVDKMTLAALEAPYGCTGIRSWRWPGSPSIRWYPSRWRSWRPGGTGCWLCWRRPPALRRALGGEPGPDRRRARCPMRPSLPGGAATACGHTAGLVLPQAVAAGAAGGGPDP